MQVEGIEIEKRGWRQVLVELDEDGAGEKFRTVTLAIQIPMFGKRVQALEAAYRMVRALRVYGIVPRVFARLDSEGDGLERLLGSGPSVLTELVDGDPL